MRLHRRVMPRRLSIKGIHQAAGINAVQAATAQMGPLHGSPDHPRADVDSNIATIARSFAIAPLLASHPRVCLIPASRLSRLTHALPSFPVRSAHRLVRNCWMVYAHAMPTISPLNRDPAEQAQRMLYVHRVVAHCGAIAESPRRATPATCPDRPRRWRARS